MSEALPQPILVVDSDEKSIDHIASGLKESGYLVITALMDMTVMLEQAMRVQMLLLLTICFLI